MPMSRGRFILMALGAAAGLAALLRRRPARSHQDAPTAADASPADPHRSAPGPPHRPADPDDRPLLSPIRFTLSHFGLLALLLAIMIGGLALRGIRRHPDVGRWHVPGGDAGRGRKAMLYHGCGGCHRIADAGGMGEVGPPLDGFARRTYIAGRLPNTPEHLIAWLRDPGRHAPGTAMPDLGIDESTARDMAAYLYTDP